MNITDLINRYFDISVMISKSVSNAMTFKAFFHVVKAVYVFTL